MVGQQPLELFILGSNPSSPANVYGSESFSLQVNPSSIP